MPTSGERTPDEGTTGTMRPSSSDQGKSEDLGEDKWLDGAAEIALESIIPHHMDLESAVLHARWWQLERYLRSLVYVELRALYGENWIDKIPSAMGRLRGDAPYTHLAGPDNDNPLAYLDFSQLIALILENWDEIGYAFPDKVSWSGRQNELQRIRHRIGHMRRPHSDDVNRLEQALRDLERGAFIAYASYNDRWSPDPREHQDSITRDWLTSQNDETTSLIKHADSRYDIRTVVHASRRPWAERACLDLEHAAGYLWHVEFFARSRHVNVFNLWRGVQADPIEPLLIQLEIHDTDHIGFTFGAIDGGDRITKAIESALRLVMANAHMTDSSWLYANSIPSRDYAARNRRFSGMDYRIACANGWTIVDSSTLPISNFGAGGGVHNLPTW